MIASKQQTGTETKADSRSQYVEASVRESIDNLVAQGYPRKHAEHLVECIGRERFEREAHAMQTQRLFTEDLPLVRTGQGEYQRSYTPSSDRAGLWVAIGIACLVAGLALVLAYVSGGAG